MNVSLNDAVHWNTGKGAGLTGRVTAVLGLPERGGTMTVEWSTGQVSFRLPQRLFTIDERWSIIPE
jgi:hypothetical protein